MHYPLCPARRTTDMFVIDKQTIGWSIRKLTGLYSESYLTLPIAFNRLTALLTIYWIPAHTKVSLFSHSKVKYSSNIL